MYSHYTQNMFQWSKYPQDNLQYFENVFSGAQMVAVCRTNFASEINEAYLVYFDPIHVF